MYMSVRKPPLSTSSKNTTKPGVLRKGDVSGTVGDQNSRSATPSVPKTVPPRSNTRRSSGTPLLFNSLRGGASAYQTTNTLFTGSSLQGKLGIPKTDNHNNNNNNNNNDNSDNSNNNIIRSNIVHDEESGHAGHVPSPRAGNGRNIIDRRLPPKPTAKRNASDNVAAVLGGSTLGGTHNNDRYYNGGAGVGVGGTRKAFSGPPSTRVPANQGGGAGESSQQQQQQQQRPHPPGSGGPKLGGSRPIHFALNANGNQRLSPMPPRPTAVFGQTRNGIETNLASPRHTRGRQQQEAVDPFATTQVLNGLGAHLASEADVGTGGGGNGGRWGKNVSPPFALASVKLQQLGSTQLPSSPNLPTTTTTTTTSSGANPRRSSLSSGALSGGKRSPTSVTEDMTSKNNLQYDFRVVASTGKSFNSPIKLTTGVGCVQGLRPTMEDEHFIRLNATSVAGQPVSLLGILDGHCGRRVADLAAKYVPDNFLSHSALGENNALAFVESIIQADRAIFHALGKGGVSGPGVSCTSSGGCTLITAAVHGRMLYVACLGDARAVLYDGNMTIPMSEDHKPTNKKEHTRILQCGGFVQFGRVCGILAVSRALGDYEFKFNGNRFIANRELMVSNVADVRQINLTDSSKFLLMACDGLWDVVENEEATQFVRDFLSYTPDVGSSPETTKRALNNCCQKLAEFAIDRGSTDNVSVMLLFFHDVADVVASFDKPAGGVVPTPPHHVVSPRLTGPSRGFLLGSTGAAANDGSLHTGNNNNNNNNRYNYNKHTQSSNSNSSSSSNNNNNGAGAAAAGSYHHTTTTTNTTTNANSNNSGVGVGIKRSSMLTGSSWHGRGPPYVVREVSDRLFTFGVVCSTENE
ncbi:protein phosphatase 2C [Trypanosoma theileri]|uniref:Protein phosphatase 2C n=1 Tax=Trypanosoma theileri TaxID=67003 RepID=A0A1X0NNL5_9TRYP|nr:protein phosphatase 2C [Trypanosoma theileri]ORC86287.1 protein phosphatase 2C [Trypanosoma theileri]